MLAFSNCLSNVIVIHNYLSFLYVSEQRKSAVSPVASSGGPPLARNHQTFLDQQAPKMDESLYVMRMSRRATYRWSKRNRKLGDLDGGGPYR